MKTHLITKDQLDQDNNYIGEVNLDNFDGNLESEEDLGSVKFKTLNIKGYIYFKAGSGIMSAQRIWAGRWIEADAKIEAGGDIDTDGSITAGEEIRACGYIRAGSGIEASSIIAGGNIRTRTTITAKKIEGEIISGVMKSINK
jgi:hypothetical protein